MAETPERTPASSAEEHLTRATAHLLNGHLQSIAACVALVRLADGDPERIARATAEIMEKTKEIGAIVRQLMLESDPAH